MVESRAKILLVDLPSVSPNELNLGLASIAAVMRARGHEVRVLDLNNLNVPGGRARRLRQALEWAPDALGVSLFPACRVTYDGARDLLRAVRAARGDRTLRVAGGVGISVAPADGARAVAGLADICVSGEGEVTFAEIVEKRLAGAPLTGIAGTVRFEGAEPVQEPARKFIADLDTLPLPAYEFFDSVGGTLSEYPMMTSRGCPFNCIFCLNKTLTRRTFRPRSHGNVVDEIASAKDGSSSTHCTSGTTISLIRERAENIFSLMMSATRACAFLPDGIARIRWRRSWRGC